MARSLPSIFLRYLFSPSNLKLSSPQVRQISFWSGFGHFFETIAIYAPLLLIGLFFDTFAAGQIGFLERVVSIPVSLLGATLGRIFLGESAKYFRDEKSLIELKLRRWINYSILSIIPISIIFYFVGKPILMLLVSGAWHPSIQILSLSMPTVVIACLWNVISNIFISQGRFRAFFAFATTRLLVVVGSLVVCLKLDFNFGTSYLIACYLVAIVELSWLAWFSKHF